MTSPPCVVTRLLLFGILNCVYRLHSVNVWPSYQSWTISATRLLCLSVEVYMQIQVDDARREFVGNLLKKNFFKVSKHSKSLSHPIIFLPQKKTFDCYAFYGPGAVIFANVCPPFDSSFLEPGRGSLNTWRAGRNRRPIFIPLPTRAESQKRQTISNYHNPLKSTIYR